MLLKLSSDQEFFRDTTARYLTEQVPVAALRDLRNDPVGYSADYWRAGAELGWVSLLVSEEHGGGSISGDPLADLTLIANEFGRHAAPGPLVPVNVVAATLGGGVAGGDAGAHADLVAALVAGEAVASWAYSEPPPDDRLGTINATIRRDGSGLVLDGVKRPVESAGTASHLLVTGRTDGGLSQVVVPTDAPGVTITPMSGVDLTRRYSIVTFDGVRLGADAAVGELGGADADVRRQLQLALIMINAEALGAMQHAFDVTVDWAFDRYAFGRPLASYQELKHRFADMKTWLEASHAISDAAVAAVGAGAPDADELLSAAKFYIGDYGSELLQDCVQIHGGLGITFEHDLHLFLRRHTINRTLYGTPADHRLRIADIVVDRERAA
jgi:alkylation response protein AidB-like acyl-CoA dehydrogenase